MSTVNSAIPTEREATRQWFGDAKFGLFVHWGVYALLGKGEWIRTTGKIPRAEYAKLQRRFNPKRFTPDAWADLAKRAGTQYVVFTTKHLDGFCMLVSTRSTGGQFRTRSVGHVSLGNGANTVKLVLRRVRRQQSLDLRGIFLKPVSP